MCAKRLKDSAKRARAALRGYRKMYRELSAEAERFTYDERNDDERRARHSNRRSLRERLIST